MADDNDDSDKLAGENEEQVKVEAASEDHSDDNAVSEDQPDEDIITDDPDPEGMLCFDDLKDSLTPLSADNPKTRKLLEEQHIASLKDQVKRLADQLNSFSEIHALHKSSIANITGLASTSLSSMALESMNPALTMPTIKTVGDSITKAASMASDRVRDAIKPDLTMPVIASRENLASRIAIEPFTSAHKSGLSEMVDHLVIPNSAFASQAEISTFSQMERAIHGDLGAIATTSIWDKSHLGNLTAELRIDGLVSDSVWGASDQVKRLVDSIATTRIDDRIIQILGSQLSMPHDTLVAQLLYKQRESERTIKYWNKFYKLLDSVSPAMEIRDIALVLLPYPYQGEDRKELVVMILHAIQAGWLVIVQNPPQLKIGQEASFHKLKFKHQVRARIRFDGDRGFQACTMQGHFGSDGPDHAENWQIAIDNVIKKQQAQVLEVLRPARRPRKRDRQFGLLVTVITEMGLDPMSLVIGSGEKAAIHHNCHIQDSDLFSEVTSTFEKIWIAAAKEKHIKVVKNTRE